jgi:signal transduction histidine kinase
VVRTRLAWAVVSRRHRSRDVDRLGDLVLGLGAAVAIVVATGRIEPSRGDRALDALAYGCMVVAGLSLAGRRRWPLAVVGVETLALGVYLARGYLGGPVFAAWYVALYSLAASRDRRVAFGAAGVCVVGLMVVGEVADTPGLVPPLVVGWAAAAVFLGHAVRNRRDYLAALEERAADLERSRDEEARRRIAEERLRIAQDLHDSVAHSMATINVQAGVAAHVIDRHPDRARDALVIVQRASGEVLDELAALLGLLRPGGDGAARAPTPSPGQLDALVASASRSGLEVTLRVDGEVEDVPQPVGVALYRIVQESLTNVVRHAGSGAMAAVTVARDRDGGLSVEVVDDGRGNGEGDSGGRAGAGMGIRGMRERAQASGGALQAGVRPAGGFAVRAVWPGYR